MEGKERLSEACGERGCRLCDAAFGACELGSEAREEVVFCLLVVEEARRMRQLKGKSPFRLPGLLRRA